MLPNEAATPDLPKRTSHGTATSGNLISSASQHKSILTTPQPYSNIRPESRNSKKPFFNCFILQRNKQAQMAQQTPINQSSPIDAPPPASPAQFPQFSRLPPEIRQQVWLHTLLSRKIMLSWRTQNSAVLAHQNDPTIALHFRGSSNHLRFDARIVEADERPEFFAKHKEPLQDYEEWEAAHQEIPPPHGPVALRVCSESRAACLSRYRRAFGSVRYAEPSGLLEEEWVITRAEAPRIWVDFEVDEIVLDAFCRRPLPIIYVERYAKDEVKKIRNLGIGRYWDEKPLGSLLPVLGWGLSSSFSSVHPTLKGSLGIFESLKELVVYDLSFDTYGLPSREPEVIEAWKHKAETQMLEELKKAKNDRPEWTAELPHLRVVCDF